MKAPVPGDAEPTDTVPERLRLDVTPAAGAPEAKQALAAYRWPAVDDGRLPLIIVHGFAEHARRHSELAAAAQEAGHSVIAVDLHGHGESTGPRGVVAGYDAAVRAVHALVDLVEQDSGRKPVLFGHSMGGAIALKFALEEPLRLSGLVLSSPFLKDAVARPGWLLVVARLLAKVVPRVSVTKLDANLISRDAGEVARYRDDPQNLTTGVPAITGRTLTDGGARLLVEAGRLAVPTLIIHGTADGVADVEGSRQLAAVVEAGPVELNEIEGGFHELFHEPVATGVPQRVTRAVLDFLVDPGSVGKHAH